MSQEHAMLVGLDWADQKHDLRCYDVETGKEESLVVASTPEALESWCLDWTQRYPGRRMAICLEQSRGPVVYALSKYAFVDLYPVNPVTVHKYRQAFCPSGSKNDPKDAALMLELIRKHPDMLKKLEPDDPCTRALRQLCEDRRKAVGERGALTNALRAVLKLYYPQALELAGESLSTELACALLTKWPRFEQIAKATPKSIQAFYHAQHCRSETLIQARLERTRSSCPLTHDPAVVEPCMLRVKTLVALIRSWNDAIDEYDRAIALQWQQHPDREIFTALPGAGKHLQPRMAAAFGTNRDRFKTSSSFSSFCGIAPVIESSGKQRWVHWRWHCPKFVRQTLVEFADHSIGQSAWAKAYYRMQRERGTEHHAAVRALAFKWIRIIHRCWITRTAYDEATYIAALRKRGSPIIDHMAA